MAGAAVAAAAGMAKAQVRRLGWNVVRVVHLSLSVCVQCSVLCTPCTPLSPPSIRIMPGPPSRNAGTFWLLSLFLRPSFHPFRSLPHSLSPPADPRAKDLAARRPPQADCLARRHSLDGRQLRVLCRGQTPALPFDRPLYCHGTVPSLRPSLPSLPPSLPPLLLKGGHILGCLSLVIVYSRRKRWMKHALSLDLCKHPLTTNSLRPSVPPSLRPSVPPSLRPYIGCQVQLHPVPGGRVRI